MNEGKLQIKEIKLSLYLSCEILWSISLYLKILSKTRMNIIIWIRRFQLWDSSPKQDHVNNRVQTGFGLCLPLFSLAAEGFFPFPGGEFWQNMNLATHLSSHSKWMKNEMLSPLSLSSSKGSNRQSFVFSKELQIWLFPSVLNYLCDAHLLR